MDNLIRLLEEKRMAYEIFEHDRTLRSAQEGADYFGIRPGQTAPTLLVKSDKGYCCVILSGDHGRMNMDDLEKVLGAEHVKLAKPAEVEQVTGSKVGNVSLINPDIPAVMDRNLFQYDLIYGGTGVPQTTLKISPKDVERLHTVIGYI